MGSSLAFRLPSPFQSHLDENLVKGSEFEDVYNPKRGHPKSPGLPVVRLTRLVTRCVRVSRGGIDMKRRPRHLSPGRQQPDITLNSFLDLVLNILLFFVFATELAVYNSLNVAVPKTEYGDSAAKDNEALLIQVTQEGRFFIGNEEIADSDLPSQMRRRKQENPNLKSVTVRGDLNSRLQATVDVLGACKEAGITKLRIETERHHVDKSP